MESIENGTTAVENGHGLEENGNTLVTPNYLTDEIK
jgi:hypothetical protein